jgi:hypothetical protein
MLDHGFLLHFRGVGAYCLLYKAEIMNLPKIYYSTIAMLFLGLKLVDNAVD